MTTRKNGERERQMGEDAQSWFYTIYILVHVR